VRADDHLVADGEAVYGTDVSAVWLIVRSAGMRLAVGQRQLEVWIQNGNSLSTGPLTIIP
jgi:hypothetical protein